MANDLFAYLDQKADQYGVPREYARAVMMQESGGNPNAISPAGAVGPMQLMRGTARELRVNPDDPYQNIDGGVRYLAQNANKYGLTGALAAYNGGPGRWEKAGGDLSLMPAETQNYVNKITGRLGGDMVLNNTLAGLNQVGNLHSDTVDPRIMQEIQAEKEMRAAMLPLALGASMSGNEGVQNMSARMLPFAMEALTSKQLKNGQILPGGTYISDVDTAADVARIKQELNPGKTLSVNAGEKLTNQASRAEQLGALTGAFEDSFAGMTPSDTVGDIENWVGRNIGLAPESLKKQANWWQRYQEQANAIRNELFGAALTKPELAAFEKANITPGMSPDMIRLRLQQQSEIAAQAHNKLLQNYGKMGYNVSNFEQMPVPTSGQVTSLPTQAPATGQPKAGLTDEQILKQYGIR